MSRSLVGYDVPGIQRYVFEPVRPLDIMGGSALLERFASKAEEIADACGAQTIYSAGGGGLFIAPDEFKGDRLSRDLQKTLEGLTDGGAPLARASVVFDGDFSEARTRLRGRLADDRLARAIDQPTNVLLPAGTKPDEVCQACGLELADRYSTIGGGADPEAERIGPRCHVRREEGRRRREAEGIPATLRDLFPRGDDDDPRGPERLPRGSVLAALYLDGDGLGRRLAEITDPDELRDVSSRLRSAVVQALESIAAHDSSDEAAVLTPVVGGDDLVVFCDARRAPELLDVLWSALDRGARLDGAPIRFSAAIVLSDPYLPLRLIFDEAKAGLETAKGLSRKTGIAHVELRTLVGGRLHGGRGTSLAGTPLPRTRFWGDDSSFRTLLEALGEVAPAQRSGIANDLSEPSGELRDLLLDERAARERNVAVQRAVKEARNLGEECDAASHDLLGAALAVVDLWGDRR